MPPEGSMTPDETRFLLEALDTEWERPTWTALDRFFDAAFPYLGALAIVLFAVGLFRWWV
jgi:hypothetical protein